MLRFKMTCNCKFNEGFTVFELIIVLSIVSILGAIAGPVCIRYYQSCCVKEAMIEIVQLVREGKMKSLDGAPYAVYFDSVGGTVTLLAGKGPDGKWNTADDIIVRKMFLKRKGGALRFGCESCASIPEHIKPDDGIALMNNIAIFNGEMTGLSSGGVYISSSSGVAMAMLMSSTESGYELWNWSNGRWVRL